VRHAGRTTRRHRAGPPAATEPTAARNAGVYWAFRAFEPLTRRLHLARIGVDVRRLRHDCQMSEWGWVSADTGKSVPSCVQSRSRSQWARPIRHVVVPGRLRDTSRKRGELLETPNATLRSKCHTNSN
jgi:hypothetical protein